MENKARNIIGKENFLRIKKGKGAKPKQLFSSIFTVLAIASLVFAFIYGKIFGQVDISERLALSISDNKIESLGKNVYVYESENYLKIVEENGYGGKLMLTPVINAKGMIDNILILDHKETFSFFMRITNKGFFKQYQGKSIEDPLIIGHP
jgi:hypothetical protein